MILDLSGQFFKLLLHKLAFFHTYLINSRQDQEGDFRKFEIALKSRDERTTIPGILGSEENSITNSTAKYGVRKARRQNFYWLSRFFQIQFRFWTRSFSLELFLHFQINLVQPLLSNLHNMISKFFLASTGMRTAAQITGQVLTSPFPTEKKRACFP